MSHVDRPILLAALALIVSAPGAAAQRSGAPGAPVDSSAALPTLSIGGRITIQELRVSSDPRFELDLTGCPLLDQVRIDQRSNLPKPVVAGVYRDVVIDAHAAVVLADSLNAGQCVGDTAADSVPGSAAPR